MWTIKILLFLYVFYSKLLHSTAFPTKFYFMIEIIFDKNLIIGHSLIRNKYDYNINKLIILINIKF